MWNYLNRQNYHAGEEEKNSPLVILVTKKTTHKTPACQEFFDLLSLLYSAMEPRCLAEEGDGF